VSGVAAAVAAFFRPGKVQTSTDLKPGKVVEQFKPDTMHEYIRIGNAGVASLTGSSDSSNIHRQHKFFVRVRNYNGDIMMNGREIEMLIEFLQDHQERSGYYED